MSDIKVVVADDEILALNGISNLIDRTEGYRLSAGLKTAGNVSDLSGKTIRSWSLPTSRCR